MHKARTMKKPKLHIVAGVLTALVLAVILRAVIVQAFFDETTAVTINPSSVENSTMIIGTHLIYLNALNDELYAIAQDSASDSGQDRIYYKSELADGTWFDITDAGSIADITTEGTVVSDDTIGALYFTHHTKSDGITYDLRTNKAVCVFDIYDTYDLENMTELQSLKNQYDMMKDAEKMSETDRRNLELIRQFFATEVHTDKTDEYDDKLAAVQKYYEELSENDADSAEIEAVVNVMAKLDNARREVVYLIVESGLDDLMDKVGDGTSDNDDIEYYDVDDTLLTAIGDCQSDLSESLIEAESNLLEKGSTVLSAKEYKLDTKLIADAVAKDFASCDTSVVKLIALSNISNELIVSKSAELSLLEEILPTAQEKYSAALAAGPSAEYQAAVAAKSSHAVLENIKKADAAVVNSARSELEFLVKAKADRLDNEEAQNYIKTEMERSSELLQAIPDDDYKTAMEESVEKYQSWQADELAELKSGSSSAGSDLYEQKEALEEERMAALDEENIDLANLLQAKIDTIDDQIAAAEEASASELKDLENQLLEVNAQLDENPNSAYLLQQKTDLQAQIADLTAGLSDASAASNIQEMKTTVMSALSDGDTASSTLSSIEVNVDGLGGMLSSGSSLALAALKEIYKKMVALAYLDDSTAYDSLIAKIEDLVSDSEVLETEESGLSQTAALSAVEDVLGGTISVKGIGDADSSAGSDTDSSGTTGSAGNAQVSVDGLSDEEVLAAMLALGDYAEDTDNDDIAALAGGIAANLAESQEVSVFETRREGNTVFVPVDMLAQFCGYRYLWNDTKKTAILSKGREYYSFTAFFSGVGTGEEEMDYMDEETQFSGTVYIPNSYVSSHFDCEIYSISDTGYSVLANDSTMEKSEELLEALLQKGGG